MVAAYDDPKCFAWAASGALAVALFGCGLLFSDLLASSSYPALNASSSRVQAYFLDNRSEVRALGFFHVLSALSLLCFAVYLHRFLKQGRGRRSDSIAVVALSGGVTAAAFLLLSALTYRTLAEPAVAHNQAVTHALVVISYLAGGPAIAAPLALLIGAASSTALQRALLPRWTGLIGLAAVTVSVLSAGVLLGPMNNSSVWYGLLLLSALLGFLWTLVTSFVLAARE